MAAFADGQPLPPRKEYYCELAAVTQEGFWLATFASDHMLVSMYWFFNDSNHVR
jgi:hypothetical protein